MLDPDTEHTPDEVMVEAGISAPEDPEDQFDPAFVDDIINKILTFVDHLSGNPLHVYQRPLAYRICESVIIGDGELLTALAARQSGKSEIIANVVAGLMVLLPRLARLFPDLLGKFKDGFWVGLFAPTENQSDTLFARITTRLTSDRATEIMCDPEIDDKAASGGTRVRSIKLKNSDSIAMSMTANPRARIESKSFHLVIIDEAQETDDFIVTKSISPMLAYYSGTMVKTGTPTTTKNHFYQSIQLNKRMATGRRSRQNHFEWTWKDVAKVNGNYKNFIKKEMLRIGEDSDEFRMSYEGTWLIERGMFVTQTIMDDLGDTSMQIVPNYFQSPVVVGIDPARKLDSTVVTVVWVDWDRPDEFGYMHHRILNWLEIEGEDWEKQYYEIVNFLKNYDVLAIGVDANGVGDAIADRLKVLIPRAEVVALTSSQTEQSKRFKHLQALIQRQMVSWPAHAKTRQLRRFKRFYQQMLDAERKYVGANFLVEAPDEAHAHDDYVDSFAIAVSMTQDLVLPSVNTASNPFYRRR